MAQARMLNRSVATDDRLNGMSHDAMLFYLMAVPHLDRDGLIDGRPRVLWAQVAPLQDAWLATAGSLIDEWVACGLVVRYGDGKPVLFFPGFQKNQPRMLYRREQVSQHPCPPGYRRTDDGLEPIGVQVGRDEVTTSSRGGREKVVQESRPTREQVASRSRAEQGWDSGCARPARAEDQEQDQEQDQDQLDDGDDLSTPTADACDFGNRARVRASEIDLLDDGSLVLTAAGRVRQMMRDGRHVSPGDLMGAFSAEQARRAAYEMGAQLGLHMEWHGFETWLERQEEPVLWSLVFWCQFYADLPPAKMEAIESLPGLIRSNLRDHVNAPLSGKQRRTLAETLDRLEELGQL